VQGASKRAQPSETIGSRIRGLRLAAGISGAQLAKRSGRSEALIHQLEQGRTLRPRVDTLAAIASVLGVTIDSLVHGPGGPTTNPEQRVQEGVKRSA